MELFNLVLKGAVIEGEAAHVGLETFNRQKNESRESAIHCGMKGDVTIVRMNRRVKDDVLILPRKMMELFNLVLEGADVGGEAALVGTETLNTVQNRNPSESAGEAQAVGETSKQINRHPSESRESSMSRGLNSNVTIVAGEAQVGETSKRNRNASEFRGRNVKSMVQFYERCSSGSRATKGEGEQGFGSTMELVRRSPRQKRNVPGVQQHPDLTLKSGILVDVNGKSSAPPHGEATSTSKTTKEGGEQDFHSTMELARRSPSQKPSVPGVQEHPDHFTPPTSGILVDVATKSAAPPPDEATSKRTKRQGEQDFYSTMEIVRRSPLQKRSVPGVQQHTDLTPTSGRILVDAAAKSAAPLPAEGATSDASAEGIQPGNRRVRRKISSSVHKEIIQAVDIHKEIIQAVDIHKEIIQAVENASKILAESIDRIHSTKLQIAENKVKSQEHLFNTELDYMKKRDWQVNRNQKNLISAINGLTKIIMTGLKDTASAGDAIQPENARGEDINTEASSQDTLQPVDKTTQQAADAQE